MSSVLTSEPVKEDLVPDIEFPPGDLWSDEPPLESDLHRQQIDLLIRLLYWFWRERNDFYASGNLTIYYSPNQLKSEHFRGPDFFVVLGTEKKDRKSWVVWQENGLYPHVIVEILSKATAKTDKQLKKEIYQNTFRTPDYFWFEPVTLELEGFHLLDGQYQPIEPNENNWLWSQQLNLYLGVYEDKLRFFTPEGGLVPLAEEEMSQRAEQERQRAEQAEQEVTRLRELLKAQGNSF
jgi:Uma2 family endonuclease